MAQSILEKQDRTVNQLAGDIKRSLKSKGIDYMTDDKGEEVPIKYVPAMELLRHFYCEELIEEAKQIEIDIAEFKHKAQKIGDTMYHILMEHDEIRADSKGGFTMGLFDKSAKVEYKMDTVETQDELMLKKAKEHKDAYVEELKEKLDGKLDDDMMYIVDLMNAVFEQTNGKVDPRRRNLLNKYRDRIKNKHFQKFLDCYNNAFDLRHTKRYEKFQERDDQNEYQSLLLNYRRIHPAEPQDDE